MQYIGSFVLDALVALPFNTRTAGGAPITFGGTPLLSVLEAATLAVVLDDLAPTLNVNGVTGRHLLTVDTSAGDFSPDADYLIAVKQGTVDGQSVAGEMIARFSMNTGALPIDSISAPAVSAAAVTKIQSGLPTAVQIADAHAARHYRGGSNAAPTNADVAAIGLMRFAIDEQNVITFLHTNGDVALIRQLSRAERNAIVGSAVVGG